MVCSKNNTKNSCGKILLVLLRIKSLFNNLYTQFLGAFKCSNNVQIYYRDRMKHTNMYLIKHCTREYSAAAQLNFKGESV